MSQKTYTQDEAAKRREEILGDPNRIHDHVRNEAINPGDPTSRVTVLARRDAAHGGHTVEDEV